MVLDSKIAKVKAHFGIEKLEQWSDLEPGWVLKLKGVGPVTLNHIRLYLAPHGIALKNDATPEYWLKRQSELRICQQMGDEDKFDVAPFCVAIDTREQAPWTFQNFTDSAVNSRRPLIVPVKQMTLKSGDYTIAGFEDHVAVERKSQQDAVQTFTHGRDRFERELDRLNSLQVAFVVIECGLGDFMARPPTHSKANMTAIMDGIDAWINRFPKVHWWWMPTKSVAEKKCYKVLSRFWRDWYDKPAASNGDEPEAAGWV